MTIGFKILFAGRGQVVSMFALHSINLSYNPAEAYNFHYLKINEKVAKEVLNKI